MQTANATVLTSYGTSGIVNQIGADTAQLFPQIYWSLLPPPMGAGGIYAQAKGSTSSAVTTLSSAASVKGFSIQGSNLYYADATGGTISRVPINGSAAPTAIALASAPVGLVADGANIYWIDGTSIMKVALSGGTGTPIATGQSAVAIAIDGSSVYWANSNGIVRYPK